MRLPVGVSDFKKLVEDEYLFADKTLFLKEVMGQVVEGVRRSRRWKNLNTLKVKCRIWGQIKEGVGYGGR